MAAAIRTAISGCSRTLPVTISACPRTEPAAHVDGMLGAAGRVGHRRRHTVPHQRLDLLAQPGDLRVGVFDESAMGPVLLFRRG